MQLQVKNTQKSKNNVFTRKQTTNKAPSKIFRGFEVGKKVAWFLQSRRTKAKLNGTFLDVKNKQ